MWNPLLAAAFMVLLGQVESTPGYGRTNVVRNGQSIQAAIKSARPGDRIFVNSGTYTEQLTIKTDGIQLIGFDVVLKPPRSPGFNLCSGLSGNDTYGRPTQAGICVQGLNVVLGPFPGSEHRKVQSVGRAIKNVVISGFKVSGFTGQNIAVVGGENTQIKNNRLSDGPTYGFLTVGSKNTLANGNVVTSTPTSSLPFIAMCMDDKGDSTEFSENDISNYTIALCVQTKNANVKKNKVKNSCVGAFVDPGVDGAQVTQNRITGIHPLCAPGFTAGIIVDGATNTLVKGNVFEQIKAGGSAAAVVVVDDSTVTPEAVSSNTNIKANVFHDNDYDLYINSKGTGNVAKNNVCSSPSQVCNT